MVYKDKLPKNFLVKRFKYIMIPYFTIGTFYVYTKYKVDGNEETFWQLFKRKLGNWYVVGLSLSYSNFIFYI